MPRLLLAAVAGILLATPIGAQSVPGRDLLEFPLGGLAGPRAELESSVGTLWNPAARGRTPGKADAAFGVLMTPVELGMSARVAAAGYHHRSGWSLGLLHAQAGVSDVFRTETDPQSLGEIPYRTSLWSLSVSRGWRGVTAGAAFRRRWGRLDQTSAEVYGADLGLAVDSIGRVPLRLAAGSLMALSAGTGTAAEARSLSGSADLRVFQRDSTLAVRTGAAFHGTAGRAREVHGFVGGRYRWLDGTAGVVRSSQFGDAVTGVRMGLGLRYARYQVGMSREDGGPGTGATYQFLLTTVFR